MKEIKGPFPDIKLLACGGVSVETIGPFLSSGADAVAFGGSIFKKEWIDSKKFSIIGEYILALINEQKRVAQ
jgi:2-dehydro-3-deoxyphosphogluconate aldolase/(4S)-4-hydroxy-2-oxoglutarate aldolase